MSKWVLKKPVTDLVPRAAIRFDDNTVGQEPSIREYLKRGIPVTMAIYFNKSRDEVNGFLTLRELDNMREYAIKHGTRLKFAQHGNTNWALGSALASYSYEQLVAEIDTDEVLRWAGEEDWTYVYVQHGEPDVQDWIQRRHDFFAKLLIEHGYLGALGITVTGLSTFGYAGAGPYNSGDSPLGGRTAGPTLVRGTEYRPGSTPDPFTLRDSYTVDLGTTVVQRGHFNGVSWENDKRSGARPFALGVNNTGDPVDDVTMDLNWELYEFLGNGGNRMFAMHGDPRSGSAASLGTVYPFAAGDVTAPALYAATGEEPFSSQHFAWQLDMLQKKDHVKLVHIDEWCEHTMGVIPDGTNYIHNPKLAIPYLDVPRARDFLDNAENRRLDPEMAIITGLGSPTNNQNTWTAGAMSFAPGSAVSGECGWEDPVGGTDWMDIKTAGVYWPAGEGLITCFENDVSIGTSLRVIMGDLRPGLYEFTLDMYQPNGSFLLSSFGTIGWCQFSDWPNAIQDAAATTNPIMRSVQKLYYGGGHALQYVQEAIATDTVVPLRFTFRLPVDPIPSVLTADTHAIASLANGATESWTVNVPGAVVGSPAHLTLVSTETDTEQSLKKDIAYKAVVTAPDTVTCYVTNNSGAAVSYDDTANAEEPVWKIITEDWEFANDVRRGIRAPMQPWKYMMSARISRDGGQAGCINNASLVRLGD